MGWKPSHHHVAIADGLNFFHAVLFDDQVEGCKNTIQHFNQVGWIGLTRESRETAKICEHDRNSLMAIGDRFLATLQPSSNRARENIQQQFFRFFFFEFYQFLFGLQLSEAEAIEIAQALFFQSRGHPCP